MAMNLLTKYILTPAWVKSIIFLCFYFIILKLHYSTNLLNYFFVICAPDPNEPLGRDLTLENTTAALIQKFNDWHHAGKHKTNFREVEAPILNTYFDYSQKRIVALEAVIHQKINLSNELNSKINELNLVKIEKDNLQKDLDGLKTTFIISNNEFKLKMAEQNQLYNEEKLKWETLLKELETKREEDLTNLSLTLHKTFEETKQSILNSSLNVDEKINKIDKDIKEVNSNTKISLGTSLLIAVVVFSILFTGYSAGTFIINNIKDIKTLS